MLYNVLNEYYEWLLDYIYDEKYTNGASYDKLLIYLHSTKFRYSKDIPNDHNREADGIALRKRFARELAYDHDFAYYLGKCSVLEMMIALALRCEEHIMEDYDLGNRTPMWFWDMIANLGLYSMTDDNFDGGYVEECITRFLDRRYREDGVGGLFTVKNCEYDLRDVEIWYQMNWYLSSIY